MPYNATPVAWVGNVLGCSMDAGFGFDAWVQKNGKKGHHWCSLRPQR